MRLVQAPDIIASLPAPCGIPDDDIFFYYDGPLFFVTRSDRKIWLWYAIDTGRRHETFLVAETTPSILDGLQIGLVDIWTALHGPPPIVLTYSRRRGWQTWELDRFPDKRIADPGVYLVDRKPEPVMINGETGFL